MKTLLLALMLMFQDPTIPPVPIDQIQTFTFQGDVTGASGSATYQWVAIIKPINGTVVFTNPTGPSTDVQLAGAGTYVLRLVVRDGTFTSFADQWLVVSGSYVPIKVTSPITVKLNQVPPPAVTDIVPPVITSVKLGGTTIPPGGMGVVSKNSVTVTLTITATDNLGVMSADMIVDGWRTDLKASPARNKMTGTFTLQWVESPMPDGSHPVIIRVYDGAGLSAEQRLTLVK